MLSVKLRYKTDVFSPLGLPHTDQGHGEWAAHIPHGNLENRLDKDTLMPKNVNLM